MSKIKFKVHHFQYFRQVTAKTVTDIGDAKTAICAAVLKYNVNLLVLGERGLGKIKR